MWVCVCLLESCLLDALTWQAEKMGKKKKKLGPPNFCPSSMKSKILVSLCILVLGTPKAHPAPAPTALHMLVASPSPYGLSRVQWIQRLLPPQGGTVVFVGP